MAQASTSMTQSGLDTFKKAVNYIMTEWPSLNLAIDNGMGGNQAREIREWMCKTISDMLIKGKEFDIEDFLGEMINQEFDTLIEDGSLEYNAKWIEKFYKDCLEGREQEVQEQLKNATVKKLSLGNVKIPAPVCQTEDSSDEDDDGDEVDDTMEQ